MAIESVDEITEKDLNPKPEYINKDRKDRESFLSQIGNFSTEERELFNLLCDNWEHEIGYAKFVTKINKKHPIEEKFLESLMKKLRVSGCGILLTKYARGERGVEKIILTDIQSPFFFFYFINNEYQKCYEDVANDYVNESNFEKYDINYSVLNPLTLNLDQLNKRFIKNEENRRNIYSINIQDYTSFYCTSVTLQDLLKVSIKKVKYYFKSENFIAFVAKIMNTSISKLKTNVDNFEISGWRTLTYEILKNKKIINGKFKNVSCCFFKAISILSFYCVNELKQKDEDLEEERKLKEVLKEISGKIREKEFTPFSQENFNGLFEEYSDPSILKSKFYENYVDNKTKTGLTEVVFIGQHYIHQDNLYKVFLDKVALATTELFEYYVNEFKKCLFSNSSDATLLEGYPFECNINDKLKSDYPVLFDLLNKKGILAEAVIHFCKKRNHSQGKMHNMLSMYFVEGTSELRSAASVFHLDVVELFEKAYSSLPGYKRFFIFIFGQYPKTVERFTGHRRKKVKKSRKSQSRKKDYDYSLRDNYQSSYSGSSPSSSKSRKGNSENLDAKNRYYNKEQIEDAWSNLGNELSRKKKN